MRLETVIPTSDQMSRVRGEIGLASAASSLNNEAVKKSVEDFAAKWRLKSPIHMTDMIAQRQGFSWLERRSQSDIDQFWDDWRRVLCNAPVIGIGCIIDRPGYVARGYLQAHSDRWLLCRSAFDIVVERAVKIARLDDRKLHIVFEADAAHNSKVTGYHQNLKTNGLAFDGDRSSKYAPLSKDAFAETLGRIQHKPKSHTLLQVADSYIYAMARYRYDRKYSLYRHLRDRRRIADFAVPEGLSGTLGVKYYCFD